MNIRDQLALTREGVMILMDAPGRQATFLVQVIYLSKIEDQTEYWMHRYSVVISDGLTWIKGKLKPNKKCEDIEKLGQYDVVQILGKDFEKNRDNVSFVLKNLKIFTSKVRRQLGKPVHYPDYYRKKEFIDIDDGNRFEHDRFITLKEAKAMKVGRIKEAVLGKIMMIPNIIDKVMNILIEDQEDRMQCCFFYPETNKYHSFLQKGKWYLFEQPILQINQRTNQIQIKIKRQSNVELANKQGLALSELQALETRRKSASKSKSVNQKERPIEQFSIKHQYSNQDLVFIIARPNNYSYLKEGRGRVYQCVDRYGHMLEIILWSQYDIRLEMKKTYHFNGLRVKSQSPNIVLQSHKKMTKIWPSNSKILSKEELYKSKKSKEKSKPKIYKPKPRELPPNVTLINLSYFVQCCEQSATFSLVCFINAYISLDSSLLAEFHEKCFHNFRRKIFSLDCNSCMSKGLRASEDPIMVGNVMECFDCKSKDVRALWNIKAVLQDNHKVIQCRMNSEVSQNLLNMTPMEGAIVYFKNPYNLLDILSTKISFKKGIFKILGKMRSQKFKNKEEQQRAKKIRETKVIGRKDRYKKKDKQKEKEQQNENEIRHQRFYNVCEYYPYNQRVINDQVMQELQRVEAEFKLTMQPTERQCSKIDTSNILTDAESYDYQDDC